MKGEKATVIPYLAAAIVQSFKGFNKDLTCSPNGTPFQYAIGETFTHDGKVVRCKKGGFHSCEYPLDVLRYYGPVDSRFAIVSASGDVDRDGEDSKIASGVIKIEAEIKLSDLATRAVGFILSRIDPTIPAAATNTGYSSAATNTGVRSAATNTGVRSAATNTGYSSAATNTGVRSAATNTGYSSAATNTGYSSAATNTGYSSAATNTGYSSAATNTGYSSAATNTGYSSAATNTGYSSAATNTGDSSAATNTGVRSAATNTGDSSAATVEGRASVAIATGSHGKARACDGSAICLVNRDGNGEIRHLRASKVGENGIEPNVWYSLNNDGEFVKVAA